MSINNILSPNKYDLYCNKFTCGRVNTEESAIQSLQLYGVNGGTYTPIASLLGNITMTLKYNYTGICTLFYDGATATSTALTDPNVYTYVTVGSANNLAGTNLYRLIPNLRAPLEGNPLVPVYTNAKVRRAIYVVNSTNQFFGMVVELSRPSQNEMYLRFYNLQNLGTGGTQGGTFRFDNGATFGLTPFTFDYIVDE